jgi:hypothetical protein
VCCFVENLFVLQPEGNKQLTNLFYYICVNDLDDSHFHSEMWTDMSSTGDRSINYYESFQAKFNAEFMSAYLNISNFMGILKQIQADTYTSIKLRSTNIRKKN